MLSETVLLLLHGLIFNYRVNYFGMLLGII